MNMKEEVEMEVKEEVEEKQKCGVDRLSRKWSKDVRK